MRVAIIGTRGIPNNYGGFEQCAEYLALGLVEKGHEVLVYNSHNHPYQLKEWNGVQIIHCYDAEYKYGTFGQFLYDRNCIKDVKKRKCDVILQLGYTSSSVWGWMLPKNVVVTTNMDGLEWKRTKYSSPVKKFLQYAEKLGVRYSDYLISDSIGIQNYLTEKYGRDSTFIAYGAYLFTNPDEAVIKPYVSTPYDYDMLIARLEPENSIEIILDGVAAAKSKRKFLVIGKHQTKYGEYLKEKFKGIDNIIFAGAIYDLNVLNNLRYYSNIYFHGHTVGGTNPSLLEAMSSNALICANDNPFNKYILGEDAFYFLEKNDVTKVLDNPEVQKLNKNAAEKLAGNSEKIKELYQWDIIVEQYAQHLNDVFKQGVQRK